MMRRLSALALVGGLLALQSSAVAQDKPDTIVKKRALYAIKYADPNTLADALKGHFKNEATITTSPAGNGLLVSGSTGAVAEIEKLLVLLDKQPRTVAVEVVIAEIVPTKWADAKDMTVADFTGPAAEVFAKLDAIPAASRVGAVQRLKLSAVEGQAVSTTSGGSKPMTTSSTINKSGFAQRSVSYHSVGSTIRLTGRVTGDDTIALDLEVQDTRLKPGEKGADGAADEPVSIDTSTLKTKVAVKAGHAVAAQALRTDGKSGSTLSLVIVTARLADAPPAGK